MPKSFGVKHKNFANCEVCPLKGRPVVPGYGKLRKPDIAFVAEAPGKNEAEQGVPLIGKSGSFLRRVIGDLGIDEDRCYFTNMCMCHPVENEKPTAVMSKACLSRLSAELADIQPKLIVTLGRVSTSYLAGQAVAIEKSHGIYKEIELRPKTGQRYSVGVIPTYHPAGILRWAERFRDFLEDLEYAKTILDGSPPTIEPPYENYVHLTTQEDFDWFTEELPKHSLVACDLETEGTDWNKDRILCAGFSWKKEHAWVLDWHLVEHNLKNTESLNNALDGMSLSLHNGSFDIPFLFQNGITNAYFYLDTMLAHYLLDERQKTHGLERLAMKWYRAPDYKAQFREALNLRTYVGDKDFAGKFAAAPKEELFDYNGADTDYTYRLTVDLVKLVDEEGQLQVLRDIEMPAARLFMEFYMNGLLVDRELLEELGQEWNETGDDLTAQMREMSGDPEMNPNSPQQMAAYMYDVLKLAPFGGREWLDQPRINEEVISACVTSVTDDPEAQDFWTSKRAGIVQTGLKGFGGIIEGVKPRTTSAYMLYWLRQQHDFPTLLLKYRHVQKRRSLYFKGFSGYMDQAGRIHPRYNLTATRTGRKQTTDPAIHNFPRGDEIYNLIIPDPGWCFIHADYSQAEMRLMGFYCEDENLLHILETIDPHTTMAMEMFGLSQEDVSNMSKTDLSDKRIAAKMITYGLPYGRSPRGLAPQLGITIDEAAEYSKVYFDRVPGLRTWLNFRRNLGVEEHMSLSLFGRRRRMPLILDKWHRREWSRQAGNFPLQSTSNDLTLLAYIKSVDWLREKGIPVKPGAHIHDSINFSVPIPMWKLAVGIIADAMADIPFDSDVPFPAEIEVGERWGGMITVHKGGEWAIPKIVDNIPKWLEQGFDLKDVEEDAQLKMF